MKKTLFILFATFVCALSSIAADEYTWKKVTANQTDWSGTYLIANTNFGGIFDGSKTENTGLTGSANAIDGSAIIKGDEFTTTTTANAFTFAKMEGGYSVQAASGEYIYNKNGSNTLFVSDDPIALTISWESNTPMISAQDGTVLQAASSSTTMFGRFRFYSVTKSPITLYKLQEASKEMHTININVDKGTIYITPDDRNVEYAYLVLNSTEYNKHRMAGRVTANQIFDAQAPLLETTDVHKGETTIQVSELLPEGDWYIVAACVKGEDNGNFVQYTRFSDGEAVIKSLNNVPFVGCKWNKGTAPWAGTYLLVAEDTEACLNGSLSGDPNTGSLQSTGNMKGSTIFDGEIETSDKAMSFTIEAMEGGYSIKSASGWYIGAVNGKNGIATSQNPLLNTIADDGTITSEGHILSLSQGKIMYRDAASEKVVPYVLTLDTTTEPADYTKATYTIALDNAAQTASVSSDMEEARFGYIILTSEEYDTHVTNGRTTANEIFDAEIAMLRGTQVKTAPYTINLSELTEGKYYIVVAGVEAEDQIFRTVYHRISEAADAEYSNVKEGCTWTKVTDFPVSNWKGTYMIVAETSQMAFNGSLSGDATTGTLQSTNNGVKVEINDNTIHTADKSQSFSIESVTGGYTIQSASGWYIGAESGKNNIVTSQTALINLISNNGNTMNESADRTLSFGNNKFMYRETPSENIAYYILTEDYTTDPTDFSKETITITVDEEAQTFTLTPSNAELPYAYIILTSAEHESYSGKTAEEVFEANAALLEDGDILTGEQTINIADLEYYNTDGTYYIYAAGVQAENMGGWNLYKRLTAVATESYTIGEPEEEFPAPGVAYSMKEKVSGLYVTLTDNAERNAILSETAQGLIFTAVEGGYTISNAEGNVMGVQKQFVTYPNKNGYKWNISNSDEALVWTIEEQEGDNCYSFKGQYGYIGFDSVVVGEQAFQNKQISNNGIFVITKMDTTGVGTVLAPQTTTGMFNLQGQRINANQRGLMILNGKKILR